MWVIERFSGRLCTFSVFPHESSTVSHWHKRLGYKLELLLADSLRVAHAAGALRSQDLKWVTVDRTVQPKAITFYAKLLHAAIRRINRLARQHGVRLRQSHFRVSKAASMIAGRHANAKQLVGISGSCVCCAAFWAGSSATSVTRSRARQRSSHVPLVEAARSPRSSASVAGSFIRSMARGWSASAKARAPRLTSSMKTSIVTNNGRAPGGLFVLHASALPDNQYDSHTLRGRHQPYSRHSPAVRASGPMSKAERHPGTTC